VGVLFPAFSTSFVQDRKRTALIFGRGVKYTFLIMFPITLLIVTLASEGLELWLGAEFALKSLRVLQWLSIGVFLNSISFMPFALLQGAGRPDITAKLHLVELPFYLLALWWMLVKFGIEGAAVAWAVRAAVDALLLFVTAQRLLPVGRAELHRAVFTSGAMIAALIIAVFIVGAVTKAFFLSLALPIFAVAAWFFILAPEERAIIKQKTASA
jgi:O-antigen/teichoic acid export membrane protein